MCAKFSFNFDRPTTVIKLFNTFTFDLNVTSFHEYSNLNCHNVFIIEPSSKDSDLRVAR